MLLAPLVVRAARAPARRAGSSAAQPPEFDTIDGPGNPVIIAGYGRFGQIVSRVLRMCGHPVHRARGELPAGRFRAPLRQQGLLRRRVAARAARMRRRPREAKLFVLAIDDVEASVKTAARGAQAFPRSAHPRARAQSRASTSGCATSASRRSSAKRFLSSLETARQALVRLGLGVAQAERAVDAVPAARRRAARRAVRGAPGRGSS